MNTNITKSTFLLSLLLTSGLYAQSVELDTLSVTAQSEEEFLQDSVKKETTSLAKEAKGETLGDYLEN
ncbi:MAG: hypothetical protein IE887_11060, partial [Campylobacterales bacterium]|nr:hypothetical protein [Campylobacterales bacterium]